MTDDFWGEFESFSNDDAPEFKFEKYGDSIMGVLRQRKIVDTKYGRKLVLVIETNEGLRTLWAGQAQLTRLLAEVKPEVGDKLGIKYVDEQDSGKGNPTKIFEVKAKRAASSRPAPPPSDEDYDAYSDEVF